jgi:hypothetical protein
VWVTSWVGGPWQALRKAAETAGPAEDEVESRPPFVVPIIAGQMSCPSNPEVVKMLKEAFSRDPLLNKMMNSTSGSGFIREVKAHLKR